MNDSTSSNIDTLELTSLDIAQEKRTELLRLFPEVRTEGGRIDFDRLKAVLGEVVDAGRERYGMNWPGKAECMRTIQAPSMGTLLPMREQSVDWDTTENVIIEGDNLEVLKLLQKSYLGRVKMIYIDPPYNTGHDFIYPDNYSESLQTYLEYTKQVDAGGRKFGTNAESDGRFHSRWLNMMYPRLFIARSLLKEDGLIMVSIDDNELKSLRVIMDEIFGEENFVDCIIWKKRYGGGAKEKHLVSLHEYVLVYARSKDALADIFVPLSEESIERYYKFKDENFDKRGPFRTHPLESMKSFEERANLRFPIEAPDGSQVMPKRQWRWSRSRVEEARSRGELHFSRDAKGGWILSSKQYLRDENGQRETKFFSLIEDVYTQHGTAEIIDLFGDAQVFSFPKPSTLISKLAQLATKPGESDIILDFFAGSGATGHATLSLNKQDAGDRKFILVQLPEETGRHDFPTISEITRERIRRVRLKESANSDGTLFAQQSVDYGFRAFQLGASNFVPWDGTASNDAEQLASQLQLGIDHTRSDRAPHDLLYEVLLKSWGEPALSLKITEDEIEGVRVTSIADGAFLICLEEEISLEFIRAIAARKPDRVVMRESSFAGNDQLKTNAVQTFKSHGVTSFKVV